MVNFHQVKTICQRGVITVADFPPRSIFNPSPSPAFPVNTCRKHDRNDLTNQAMFSFAFFLSLAPLIIVLKSPTGKLNGKSTLARRIAKKIHHPAADVTNVNAPPATTHLFAAAAWAAPAALSVVPYALPNWKNAPARHPKAHTRDRKITMKTTFVRMEQMR